MVYLNPDIVSTCRPRNCSIGESASYINRALFRTQGNGWAASQGLVSNPRQWMGCKPGPCFEPKAMDGLPVEVRHAVHRLDYELEYSCQLTLMGSLPKFNVPIKYHINSCCMFSKITCHILHSRQIRDNHYAFQEPV